MMIDINFSSKILSNNIRLFVMTWEIYGFKYNGSKYDFSPITQLLVEQITQKYTLDTIKSHPIIRTLRQFYWQKLHIDPTKIRPSSEALVRRVLRKHSLPTISPFVDAYNWASAYSFIPMGAYDLEHIIPPLELRLSVEGESFTPIGKAKTILPNKTLVLVDSEQKIISQFPYRDSQLTKITPHSQSLILIACGVENIPQKQLISALAKTKEHLNWFAQQGLLQYKDGGFNFFKS